MQDQGTPIRVQGKHLRCVHCGSSRFVRRKAQFDVAFMAFFGADWVEKTAEIFVCTTCGRFEWFLDPTVALESAADDDSEPTECI